MIEMKIYNSAQPRFFAMAYKGSHVAVKWLFLIVSLLVLKPVIAKPSEDAQRKILVIAVQLEKEPSIPAVSAKNLRVVYEDSTGYAVSVQPSTLNISKSDGSVAQNTGVLFTTPPDVRGLESFIFQYKTRIPDQKIYAEGELATVASEFARKYYPQFWQIQGKVTEDNYISKERDVRNFTWNKLYDGLDVGSVNVSVRLWDKKVVNATGSTDVDVASKLKQAKFTPDQAKAMLLSHAEKHANKNNIFSKIELSDLTLRNFGKPSKLSYVARMQATRRSDNTVVKAIDVLDAVTGKFFTDQIGFASSREQQKSTTSTSDMLPVWSSRGLTFVSQRQLEAPEWAKFGPQLITNFSKSLTYLTYDLGATPTFVSTGVTSSWIAMERQEWAFAFDTATGSYRILGTPERFAVTPTIAPDGTWAIISASSPTGNAGYDLFADHISARGPELQLRARLVIPGSDEHHPLYSPDGKSLYFVSTKQEKDKVTHALQRISASVAQAQELIQVQPAQIQTVVAVLPADVQRISFFPDGKQLLLQTVKGIFVVAVEGGKLTPIILPKLQDAELGNAPLQQISDAWAGPNAGEVTFSAQTIDADKKERRRIYSCRFDGSNLRALTPKDNRPVPAYKFPQGEKTAYELAKEMALSEIAWDEKHRDH